MSFRAGELIEWHENTDGAGTFEARTIATHAFGVGSIDAADVDSDGDLDVLITSHTLDTSKVAWYENTGTGDFGQQLQIPWRTPGAGFPISARAADVDGDSDLDVVSAHRSGHVVWTENVDGRGRFGDPRPIAEIGHPHLRDDPRAVLTGDFDGDSDLDVVVVLHDATVALVEQLDGSGVFAAPVILDGVFDASDDLSQFPTLYSRDADDDGDLDLLTFYSFGDVEADWFENDGTVVFTPASRSMPILANGRQPNFAADFDGDGDLDFAYPRQYIDGDWNLDWYETLEDTTLSPLQRPIALLSRSTPQSIVADLNGDGLKDVVTAASGIVAWHDNRVLGDVDRDGHVDFSDLVVFAENFGKHDATWGMGDFDGDGRVRFADFVILAENFGWQRATAVMSPNSATFDSGAADRALPQVDDELNIGRHILGSFLRRISISFSIKLRSMASARFHCSCNSSISAVSLSRRFCGDSTRPCVLACLVPWDVEDELYGPPILTARVRFAHSAQDHNTYNAVQISKMPREYQSQLFRTAYRPFTMQIAPRPNNINRKGESPVNGCPRAAGPERSLEFFASSTSNAMKLRNTPRKNHNQAFSTRVLSPQGAKDTKNKQQRHKKIAGLILKFRHPPFQLLQSFGSVLLANSR